MEQLRLSHILKKLIADRRITLRELSRVTQVPQSSISGFLAGSSTSKPQHILALARYFGVSMEFLMFGKDSRPPGLDDVLTEGLFEGWLKVRIEKAVPGKRRIPPEED